MVIWDVFGIILVGLFVWGVVALVGWINGKRDKNGASAAQLRKMLNKAENTLRRIANSPDSGSAGLDASVTLNEIERFYETKELN